MIVSHKHRFICVKTHKTAGTSIEISLSRYCGASDIVTPINPLDEAVRRELGRGPQNYDGPLWRYRAHDLRRLLRNRRRGLFYNHMSAHRVRQLMGQPIWDEYFTFCFERNPWDKVVSAYYWDQRRVAGSGPVGQLPFSDYLARARRLDVRDFPLYAIDGKVAVDRVGRFEDLTAELTDICREIGIEFDGWLPNAKAGYRSPETTYQHNYSSADRDVVARRFKREIDLFGYQFDPG